jgi:hypothetical protein
MEIEPGIWKECMPESSWRRSCAGNDSVTPGKKPFDPCWQGGYLGTVNGNLNLLLSSALLLSRAAVGL